MSRNGVEGPERPGTKGSGRKKPLLRALLFAVVGVAGLLVLGTSGMLLSSVTQSGDAAAVFTDAAELPEDLLDAVTWLPDADDIPRPMEPLTRADVTAAWIRAWSQLTVAAETGDTSGMEVYFSNSALEGVLASAESSRDRPVFQVGHELELTFYSEDGQVVGLTAVKSRLLRAEPFDDGIRRFFASEESFEAVLVLEDGNWRIQHWVRRSVDGNWLVGGSVVSTNALVRRVDGGPSLVEVRLPGLSPSAGDHVPVEDKATEEPVVETPSVAEISAVFAAVEDQSAVLRVPVGFDELGGREPTDEMLAILTNVLDVAADDGRLVVLSLFDERVDFRPSLWDGDQRHVEAIRTTVDGHSALVSLELNNDEGGSAPHQADLFAAWLVSLERADQTSNPAAVGSSRTSLSSIPLSVGRGNE